MSVALIVLSLPTSKGGIENKSHVPPTEGLFGACRNIKAAMGVHQKEYNRGSARTASGSV